MSINDLKKWDDLAEDYDRFIGDQGDTLRRDLLDPALFGVLPDLKGKSILDLGCGNGYLSVKLTQLGGRVTGVDGSSRLIELAQARAKRLASQATFVTSDLTKLLPFEPETFDLTIAHLVLMDVSDCDILIQEVYRTLRPYGTFIFSILHPAFTPPVGRFRRGLLGRLNRKFAHFRLSQYFDHQTTKKTIYRSHISRHSVYYHRPISYYTNLLTKHGLTITRLIEPRPSPEFLKQHPHYYYTDQIALFLLIAAERP